MKEYVYNCRYKLLISFFVIFGASLGLICLTSFDSSTALLMLYGAKPAINITAHMGYCLYIIAVQYFNAETVLPLMKNLAFVYVRFRSKKSVLRFFIVTIMLNMLAFVCIALLANVSAMAVVKSPVAQMDILTGVFIIVKAICSSILVALVQFLCLLIIPEAQSFLLMSFGAVVWTFVKPIIHRGFLVSISSILRCGFGLIVLSIVVLVAIDRVFFRKWGYYANSNQ